MSENEIPLLFIASTKTITSRKKPHFIPILQILTNDGHRNLRLNQGAQGFENEDDAIKAANELNEALSRELLSTIKKLGMHIISDEA